MKASKYKAKISTDKMLIHGTNASDWIDEVLDTMNHKTLEDVEDKVNKHVEYQIGSVKFIALKNLKGIIKTLKI